MNVYQSYVVIFIETSCFFLFNTAFSKCELRFAKWTQIIWLAVMSAVLLVISDVFEQNFLLKQMVNLVVFISGSIIIEKKSIRNAIIVSTLFIFILLAADMITILIDRNVFEIDINGQNHINVFVTLMSKSILLILVLFLKKFGNDRWLRIGEEKDVMFFSKRISS